MVYNRGSIYLVGFSKKHAEIRPWKVNRIQKIEMTRGQFTRPDGFDLSEHFADAFGVFQGISTVTVRILFDEPVARHVQESKWHESQELHTRKDGSVVAKFVLNDTHEISRWVLSFGKYAEVLEPGELREELKGEIGEMGVRYG